LVDPETRMSNARDEILQRIGKAITNPSVEEPVNRAYRRSGILGREEGVELFCQRVREYEAEVERLDDTELAARISKVCNERNLRTLVVPAGIPAAWRCTDVELVDDHGLSTRALDRIDGVFTGCTAAVAETGTIILTTGPEEGRRALSLVPDLHICVVRESQIVELLPEALSLLVENQLDRRPITFISGPSATSDIELNRVEGVHGPRTLVVLVVKESQ
jgi:L-lactate dehydrogenase complex protein LldG